MKFQPLAAMFLIFPNILVLAIATLVLNLDRAWSTTIAPFKHLHENTRQHYSESTLKLADSIDSPSAIPNLDYLDPKLTSSFFLTADSYFIPVDVLPNNGLDAFRSSYTLIDFYSPTQEVSILNIPNALSEFPQFPEPDWQDRIFRFK